MKKGLKGGEDDDRWGNEVSLFENLFMPKSDEIRMAAQKGAGGSADDLSKTVGHGATSTNNYLAERFMTFRGMNNLQEISAKKKEIRRAEKEKINKERIAQGLPALEDEASEEEVLDDGGLQDLQGNSGKEVRRLERTKAGDVNIWNPFANISSSCTLDSTTGKSVDGEEVMKPDGDDLIDEEKIKSAMANNMDTFFALLQSEEETTDNVRFPLADNRANGFAPTKAAIKFTAKLLGGANSFVDGEAGATQAGGSSSSTMQLPHADIPNLFTKKKITDLIAELLDELAGDFNILKKRSLSKESHGSHTSTNSYSKSNDLANSILAEILGLENPENNGDSDSPMSGNLLLKNANASLSRVDELTKAWIDSLDIYRQQHLVMNEKVLEGSLTQEVLDASKDNIPFISFEKPQVSKTYIPFNAVITVITNLTKKLFHPVRKSKKLSRGKSLAVIKTGDSEEFSDTTDIRVKLCLDFVNNLKSNPVFTAHINTLLFFAEETPSAAAKGQRDNLERQFTLTREIMKIAFLAINKIQCHNCSELLLDSEVERFERRYPERADLQTAYDTKSALKPLLSEIKEHVSAEEEVFKTKTQLRLAEYKNRITFLKKVYFFDETENEKAPYKDFPQMPADSAVELRNGEKIAPYVLEDMELWFDTFVEASAVMQYAIYYNYETYPGQAELMKKSKKLNFSQKLNDLVKDKYAKLTDNLQREINKLHDEKEYINNSGSQEEKMLADAKFILEEQKLKENHEKLQIALDNCREFFYELITGNFDNVNKNVPVNTLAKFAIDGFSHFMGDNYLWHFVNHIFVTKSKSPTTTTKKPFKPNAVMMGNKVETIMSDIQNQINSFPREQRADELMSIVVGPSSMRRYETACDIVSSYESCADLSGFFSRVSFKLAKSVVTDNIGAVQHFSRFVCEKASALENICSGKGQFGSNSPSNTGEDLSELTESALRDFKDLVRSEEVLTSIPLDEAFGLMLKSLETYQKKDGIHALPTSGDLEKSTTTTDVTGVLAELDWEHAYPEFLSACRILLTRSKEVRKIAQQFLLNVHATGGDGGPKMSLGTPSNMNSRGHGSKNIGTSRELSKSDSKGMAEMKMRAFEEQIKKLSVTNLTTVEAVCPKAHRVLILHAHRVIKDKSQKEEARTQNIDTSALQEISIRLNRLLQIPPNQAEKEKLQIEKAITVSRDDLKSAKEYMEKYYEKHAEVRLEMLGTKKEREDALMKQLDEERMQRHVDLLEKRNFTKLDKLVGYEKRRANGDLKKPNNKKLPFFEGDDLDMANVHISKRNAENLISVLRQMPGDSVQSNKKKALIDHSLRMHLANLEKKMGTNRQVANKTKTQREKLDELEKMYDEFNHKENLEKFVMSDQEIEQELEVFVNRKKAELWEPIEAELDLMESGLQNDPDFVKNRDLVKLYADQKNMAKKVLLVQRSVAFCKRNMLYLEQLFRLTSFLGGPFWYMANSDAIFELAINRLQNVVDAMFKLDFSIENASVANSAQDDEDFMDVHRILSGDSNLTSFDFKPAKNNSLPDKSGNTITINNNNTVASIEEQTAGVEGQSDRAAFLARHLKNTMKLKEALDKGVAGRSDSTVGAEDAGA